MHHVVLERWSRGRSALHARDPRAKILALVVFLIALGTTPAAMTPARAGYAILLAAGLALSRLPAASFLLRAAVVLPFSATFAVLSWLAGDATRAVALVEKSYLSAAAVLLLVGTTPLPQLLKGLESLGVPRFVVLVVQFLYRYLFVISEQAQHMRLAAQCRSGACKARRSRFQAAAGALGVLFARSYARAEGIHQAMLARGFEGRFSMLAPARMRWSDAAFLGSAAALAAWLRLGLPGIFS